MMIKIGIIHSGYNSRRNFSGLSMQSVKYIRVWDVHKIMSFLIFKILGRSSIFHDNYFNDFGLSPVSGYHFFNAISPVKKPWAVTFEESLPRNRVFDETVAELLASNYCKAIIALSRRAYDIQCEYIKDNKLGDVIKSKMFVLRPSQEILVDVGDKDFSDSILSVVFIGRHFYRKGGLEVLRAINKLDFNIDFKLISNLEIDGWRDEFVVDDYKTEVQILLGNDKIEYYNSLSNDEVLKILKKSHIVLMPSFGETYGYSVLEGMASGCVPIVTNISAFLEFCDHSNSFIIELNLESKTDVNGILDIDNPMSNELIYHQNSRAIEDGVCYYLKKVHYDRKLLEYKSFNALETIRKKHNPLDAVNQLEKVYNNFQL